MRSSPTRMTPTTDRHPPLPHRRGTLGTWLILSCCLGAIGCSARPEIAAHTVRTEGVRLTATTGTVPTEETLFRNLPVATTLFASPAPDFASPAGDRPCCAFGYDFSVQLGEVPIPGFNVDNIVEAAKLGSHVYGGPMKTTSGSLSGGLSSPETNGITYSCHAGFVDIAHVRDYADWTAYLYYQLEPVLESGAILHLDDEGSRRFVVVPPIAIATLGVSRSVLALELAQWVAYELSIWHEVATWYGWSNWSAFSEVASAFSPEDLYSNLVGVKLAAAILAAGAGDTPEQFGHSVDLALPEVLTRLGSLPRSATRTAFNSVDGTWWSSSEALPSKRLLRHRSFDIGPRVEPWLVPAAAAWEIENVGGSCRSRTTPVALSVPGQTNDWRQRSGVRLYFYLEGILGEAVPRRFIRSRWLTDLDMRDQVNQARIMNQEEFGMAADRP